MKKFLDNIADIFKVKTLITLGIVGACCWGFIKGLIATEMFAAMTGSVITYYFTRDSNK